MNITIVATGASHTITVEWTKPEQVVKAMRETVKHLNGESLPYEIEPLAEPATPAGATAKPAAAAPKIDLALLNRQALAWVNRLTIFSEEFTACAAIEIMNQVVPDKSAARMTGAEFTRIIEFCKQKLYDLSEKKAYLLGYIPIADAIDTITDPKVFKDIKEGIKAQDQLKGLGDNSREFEFVQTEIKNKEATMSTVEELAEFLTAA